MTNNESIMRSNELSEKAQNYSTFKKEMTQKMKQRTTLYERQKGTILKHFHATEEDFNDYHWQLKHLIKTVDELKEMIVLTTIQEEEIRRVEKQYRFQISPYYAALIGINECDPIFQQAIPSLYELNEDDFEEDPMHEEFTNPRGSITRRYPDRLIINVTNACAMFCRHCQRRRLIKETDHDTSRNAVKESVEYIKEHPEIRDVLLTGGDALLLSDERLEEIIKQIYEIPHVEMIRLGTRTIVTMPQRITKKLVMMLKQYQPLYINTQFNHPFELTKDSRQALKLLADNGISVGNQMVLLKGINNDKYVVRYLNQQLLKSRCRPYYMFHAKKVKGTKHFIPSLREGMEIMKHLRGNTSGMAIPTYILNAPGGLGKIPLLPPYIIREENGVYEIKTWEDKVIFYQDV